MPHQRCLSRRPHCLCAILFFLGTMFLAPSWRTACGEGACPATGVRPQRGNQSAARGYEHIVARLQAAIQHEVVAKDLPAFSIVLVDDNRTVWAEGFGFQDTAREVPATAETIYRVGSVSKLFTDIAVMQLVEQKHLDLDAPVTK